MSRMRMFGSRLRALFSKRRADENLEAELQVHLDSLMEENIRRGMSPEEARYAARREFGGFEQTKEAYREQRGLLLVETLLQDARFALRLLRKNPGFTLAAVLTLALGIGVNSAAFSLVDAVLLRPLPYQHPERLMLVSESLPQLGDKDIGVAAAEYLDYRDGNRSFSQIAAYETDGFNLTGPGAPLRVTAAKLSASTFPLLGVKPTLGRTFTEDEDRFAGPKVVVLSNALWVSHYGRDPQIVGKVVKLDEQQFTVIGVMPASFRYPFDGSPLAERADVWVPQAISPERLKDRVREFGVYPIARLKPGVTPAQAQADVELIAANFMRQHPETYSGTIRVVPHAYPYAAHTIAKTRPLVLLLEAAVLCVLLIACANVANLLLAKAGNRTREMAVRRAVGADRARLLRQCMVESLLLSWMGAAAGILLAFFLMGAARRFGPADVPQLQDVSLNAPVIVFTLLLSRLPPCYSALLPRGGFPGSPRRAASRNPRKSVGPAEVTGYRTLLPSWKSLQPSCC